jgi:hypothetical protein
MPSKYGFTTRSENDDERRKKEEQQATELARKKADQLAVQLAARQPLDEIIHLYGELIQDIMEDYVTTKGSSGFIKLSLNESNVYTWSINRYPVAELRLLWGGPNNLHPVISVIYNIELYRVLKEHLKGKCSVQLITRDDGYKVVMQK